MNHGALLPQSTFMVPSLFEKFMQVSKSVQEIYLIYFFQVTQ